MHKQLSCQILIEHNFIKSTKASDPYILNRVQINFFFEVEGKLNYHCFYILNIILYAGFGLLVNDIEFNFGEH
jgi:hypothetical protein